MSTTTSVSSTKLSASAGVLKRRWEVHGANSSGIVVERQVAEPAGGIGKWERIAKLPAGNAAFADRCAPKGRQIGYRVHAIKDAGESAYSIIVRMSH